MIGDVYKTCFWKSVHKGRPPGVISVEAPPGSHLRQLPQRSRELISLKWVPWPDRKVIWIGPLWLSRLTRWWVGQPILWRLGSDKMSLWFDFQINHQVSQRRLKLSGRLNILKKKNITKPFKREIWNAELDLNIPHPLYSAELNACCSIGSVQLSWTERVYSTQLNWVELNAWVWVHPYIRPKTEFFLCKWE